MVDRFLVGFRVPEGGKLFTFWGKEVYLSGETCVVMRVKKCTFAVIK